jgi:hypothetical protein
MKGSIAGISGVRVDCGGMLNGILRKQQNQTRRRETILQMTDALQSSVAYISPEVSGANRN